MDSPADYPPEKVEAWRMLGLAASALDPRVLEIERRLSSRDGLLWLDSVSSEPGVEGAASALLREVLQAVDRAHAGSMFGVPGESLPLALEVAACVAASDHEPYASRCIEVLAARDRPAESEIPESRGARLIGSYQLLEPLGSGASGLVFRARHRDHGGLAAVKLLRIDAQSPRQAERFRTEARILSKLSHPAIVRVIDSGVALRDGLATPYLVSELIEGHPFDLALRGSDLALVLRSFSEVCEALVHAHERGILHRDLKPANVLVDADRHPHVLDFGLARDDDAGLLRTASGEVLGTLASMSPEQARGESASERSDVWSLGALLFVALAGEAPHDLRQKSSVECLRQIGEVPARSLRSVLPSVEIDVAAVVDRALAWEPNERYASVAELLFDVRRMIAGDPVHARPPRFLEALARFARRHRIASAIGASILVVLLIAGAITLMALRSAWSTQERLLETIDSAIDYVVVAAERIGATDAEKRVLEHLIESVKGLGEGVSREERWSREARVREAYGDQLLRSMDPRGALEQRDLVLDLERRRLAIGEGDILDLAEAMVKRGDLDKHSHRALAQARYEQAHAILEQAVAVPGASLRARDDLGWSYERLAAFAIDRGDRVVALDLGSRRMEIAEALLREQADELRHYAMANGILVSYSPVGAYAANDDAARELQGRELERACHHALEALRMAPEHRGFLHVALIAHQRRAEFLMREGKHAIAAECILRTRAWLEAMLVREPAVLDWRRCSIEIQRTMAICREAAGEVEAADVHWENAWEQAMIALAISNGSAPEREFALDLAYRSSLICEQRRPPCDPGPWIARRLEVLARAELASDVQAAELAQLALWLRRDAPEADRRAARAEALARRAAGLVDPLRRSDLQRLVFDALSCCELTAEAEALRARIDLVERSR